MRDITESEHLFLLAGLLALVVLLLFVLLHTLVRQRQAPAAVPPTVAPMVSPLDEEVRNLRHWRSSVETVLPELTHRVLMQGEQLAAVRADISDIKRGQQSAEHMLGVLLEVGLRGAARERLSQDQDGEPPVVKGIDQG